MPDLSPKQLAVWLLIAASILFVGARALRGEQATRIDPGLTSAGAGIGAAKTSGTSGKADDGAEVSDSATDPATYGRSGRQRLLVHVAGSVRRPGLYRLRQGARVADALRQAGGAARRADLDRINLAATVEDGQQVLVPRQGEAVAGIAAGSSNSGSAATSGSAPISLSTATAADLETIDGIGPVTANKILEFRDAEGRIDSIEQLDAISGIGPATMETLRQALLP